MRRLLLLIPLIATALTAADFSGHYVLRGVMEVGSELLLKPDGTFEFMLAYGAADYYAKGSWRAESGAVILNTEGKDEPPFRLTRSAATGKAGTRIWVLAANGNPVPNIDVVLDGVTGRTGDNGSAEFPDKTGAHSATLSVRVYELDAGPFTLNSAHNDFYFEINGDAITRVPFKNERLKLDGVALMMTHWGSDHPMRYEKQ